MLKQNKNWLAVIAGETGSGKSYSSMSLADSISPRGFNVDRDLILTPEQFLRKLNDKANLKRGDVWIFDEAGVGMASRDWYSVQNKILGSVLQTFRNKNIGVIFTVPNLSFVDVQARKLFHNYFETSYTDFEEEVCYLRMYEIQHNSRLDKTYYKFPKFDVNGRNISIEYLGLHKPPPEMCREYEQIKSIYTDSLNANALKELTTPKGNSSNRIDSGKVILDVINDKTKYVKEYNQRKFIDESLLRKDFGLSIYQAKTLKREIEDKIF